MFYANPIFNPAGKVAGVVVLRIKASSIADILEAITAGTGRVPFMIDGDGILIYYPDQALIGAREPGSITYRPIARLTAAANALKVGDYDNANITVSSTDEIGRLARTFNVMIDVLRQRERERSRGKREQRDHRDHRDGED